MGTLRSRVRVPASVSNFFSFERLEQSALYPNFAVVSEINCVISEFCFFLGPTNWHTSRNICLKYLITTATCFVLLWLTNFTQKRFEHIFVSLRLFSLEPFRLVWHNRNEEFEGQNGWNNEEIYLSIENNNDTTPELLTAQINIFLEGLGMNYNRYQNIPGLTLLLAYWLSWQDLAKFLLHLGNHGTHGKILIIKILLR